MQNVRCYSQLIMKVRHTLIFLSLFFSYYSSGQSWDIKGTVLNTEFEKLPQVNIYDKDTILLTTTDWEGHFNLSISKPSNLIFAFLATEWESIMVSENCTELEVIMIPQVRRHYKSHRKIDRHRKKDFNDRMNLYEQAFEQGLFKSSSPCFEYKFIPDKPALDEIRSWMNEKDVEIKEKFKQLQIGDTIYIPYSGPSTNQVHSAYSDYLDYDCLITGIVSKKDRKRRGLNINYNVINMDKCVYDNFTHKEKVIKIGDSIRYNMRHCRLITASNII
jgi:hypothetical protein